MAAVAHEVMTTDELRERIDAVSRDKLGLGVDELVGRYKDRALDLSSPAVSDLGVLVRLLLASTGDPAYT